MTNSVIIQIWQHAILGTIHFDALAEKVELSEANGFRRGVLVTILASCR